MSPRIVVIGAGVIGAALAHRLTGAGAQVTLVDAARPGTGTSASSFAWLNANNKQPRDYFELNVAAMRAWAHLAVEFDHPTWYLPAGNLTWATDDGQRAELDARVRRLRDWDYPAELITPQRAAGLQPGLRVPAAALAAFFPAEGFTHTTDAVTALVDRAGAAGAHLITDDPVVDFRLRGDRVAQARLASGDTLTADVFVCCTGWRIPDLLARAGVRVPLVPADQPGSPAPCLIADTSRLPEPMTRIVHAPDVDARPTSSGGVRLEATSADHGIDQATPQTELRSRAQELLTRARSILPALAGAFISAAHRCVRPLPPDGFPIAGWCTQVQSLYVIVTHSGVTLAPHLAGLTSSEILTGHREEALDAYRPDRFDPGTTAPQ